MTLALLNKRPFMVQLTVVDKDILFIISYEYRLVALCFVNHSECAAATAMVCFPAFVCGWLPIVYVLCKLKLVLRILCGAIILSDNRQPTQSTSLTHGGVLVVNDDSCRTNKGQLHTRCHSFISIQPWRPGLAVTRVQSCDRYGSGTLHPGRALGGSLPLLSPALRRSHFSRQVPPSATTREILAAKVETVGEKDVW